MTGRIYNLQGVTPLIVDDNKSMRSLLYVIMRRLGAARVLQAANAHEAMALIRLEQPDFMIIDYLLGDIDGIAVLNSVRNDDESPNPFLPTMMITGFAEPDVVFRARDAGVNEFVAKPVSVESIANRLTLMIDKARPFVRAKSYFGPDRRRRKKAVPDSPQRRATDKASEEAREDSLAIID
jgi:two-component system chemotaxis response regulator CheY